MLEQATLRERFQTLLEQHRQALMVYESVAGLSSDPAVRKQALQLRKEKQRHIRLTERLLEIVD
jgi:rubrerythrin